ncbi:MAG: alpha-amylase [Actinobacteria bacterium]|nr:alpha-amylase [Actinomycetota bacterium]
MAGSAWWRGAVLYQVYVRSFRDTDGDGYGDLPGVTAGLDHLAWLGVDGIWLSPTMPSPDLDWGYDVSDYLGVHPELGTMADLDRLIAEAGRRGIRVLLDLVPNHTSDAHPWFADARAGRGSAHRDYYVWADPAPGGGPPNNWRDTLGDPAWTLDAVSGQYYLHNFVAGQPDLNWWHPAVHEEFRQILRFWFGRGVAGVRIDVAHGLYKDAKLRDNPPADGGPDARAGLKPVYNANRPETHGVYRDWRKLADGYDPPRLLLGETWVADAGRMASYYGRGDELQLAFNFPFLLSEFTAPALAGVVADTLRALPAGACPVWTGSNHDVSRFPTRWGGGDERKARLALLLLALLPGTLMLYYGDEIGMTDADVPPGLRRDRVFGDGVARGIRDRSRTPMQWDASPGAGFTPDGTRPWLPVADHLTRNVAAQRDDPGSMLQLCRDLLALRRTAFGGEVAPYRQLPGPAGAWAFEAGELVVLANLTDGPVTVPGPAGQVLLAAGAAPGRDGPGWPLAPWQGVVIRPGR